ncbi:unnamed protein product, partial [Didymodactylos carnosus]
VRGVRAVLVGAVGEHSDSCSGCGEVLSHASAENFKASLEANHRASDKG